MVIFTIINISGCMSNQINNNADITDKYVAFHTFVALK